MVEMDGLSATVQMEDGGSRVVSVPEMLDVEVGTTVKIADPGDGKPIFLWDQ